MKIVKERVSRPWGFAALVFVLFATALQTVAIADIPRMTLRLRGNQNADDVTWAGTLKAISENPGCCDEVWFSTGTAFPEIGWHLANADRLKRYADQLRALGIAPSLQFQATLGHGDSLGESQAHLYVGKTWRGFTGRKGVECRFCNCPRQAAFLEYVRRISAMYAEFRPYGLWIDDDLRITGRSPAAPWSTQETNYGCWCDDCIAAFNAETGGCWTREKLDAAFDGDAALRAKWRAFSVAGICRVAEVVVLEFKRLSPETVLAIQHGSRTDYVPEIMKTLHKVSGKPIGVRPGGGAYYEIDVREQIVKSIESAGARRNWEDPDFVSIWTPEVETWPRAYASRSAQSLIIEAFVALAYGMNSTSFFIMDSRYEESPLYSVKLLKPLAAAAPVIAGYARANEGTKPVGFAVAANGDAFYQFALSGVPVVRWGVEAGRLDEQESGFCIYNSGSKTIQSKRDELDVRAGGLPAKLATPFVGLMIPRVDSAGGLKTLAVVNTCIDEQNDIEIRLKKAPAGGKVVWRELRRAPVELKAAPCGNGAKVVIPSVAAWNGGYIEF